MPPWTVSKAPRFATPYGFRETASTGINISGSASANTKGSYGELTPATVYDTDGIYIYMSSDVAANITNSWLVDLAIGAGGSEVPIVANMPLTGKRTAGQFFFVPVTIPSGTRLSARCAVLNVAANARGMRISVVCMPRAYVNDNKTRHALTYTYGANEADSGGVQVDPGGAANTKGSYSEIVASTAAPIRQVILTFNLINNTAASNAHFLFDFAMGTAGSEQIILPNIALASASGSDGIYPPVYGPIPVNIPAGVRLAMRSQSDITDATDRLVDVSVIGVT